AVAIVDRTECIKHRLVRLPGSVAKSARRRLQRIYVACAVDASELRSVAEPAFRSDGDIGFRSVSVVSVKAVERGENSGTRDPKDRAASSEATPVGPVDGGAVKITGSVQSQPAVGRRSILTSGKGVQHGEDLRLRRLSCNQRQGKEERQHPGVAK